MQRSRPFLLLGLATCMAFVTSLLVYNLLAQQSQAGQFIGPRTELVAVAARQLYWGTKLTKEMIKLVPFPHDSLPDGYFSSLIDVGHWLDETVLATFHMSSSVFIVLTPTLNTIHSARTVLTSIFDLGFSLDHIKLIYNRYHHSGELTIKDSELLLKKIFFTFFLKMILQLLMPSMLGAMFAQKLIIMS